MDRSSGHRKEELESLRLIGREKEGEKSTLRLYRTLRSYSSKQQGSPTTRTPISSVAFGAKVTERETKPIAPKKEKQQKIITPAGDLGNMPGSQAPVPYWAQSSLKRRSGKILSVLTHSLHPFSFQDPEPTPMQLLKPILVFCGKDRGR